MATYMIEAGDVRMGEYAAETMECALNKYARDAGYADYDEVVREYGDVRIYRIDEDRLTADASKALDAPIFQDGYGGGVALVNGESVSTLEELAEMADLDIDDYAG